MPLLLYFTSPVIYLPISLFLLFSFSHLECEKLLADIPHSISFFFSRELDASLVISLVTRSFLRARQVIFHRLLSFFVHCAEIAGALALPQLIFRRLEARLSIGRRWGRRPFPRREHRAHPSSETESLLQRNTIPARKTGKLISPELSQEDLYTPCAANSSSVSSWI